MIYSDNGGQIGNRTRLFRDCIGSHGVEWMYAVDYAGGSRRWFGLLCYEGQTIEKMQRDGMNLTPYKEGASA
jgi:hypothetical protein